MEINRLYRSKKDRIIAGVCGGLGKYFSIDPILPRLIFIALTISGGAGVIIYIIMALVVPEDDGSPVVIDITKEMSSGYQDKRYLLGLLILMIGLVFLLQQFFPVVNFIFSWRFLLPILLIVFGVSLIIKRSK